MRKIWIVLMVSLLLTGCGTEQTVETVTDVYTQPELPPPQQTQLTLPAEAVVAVMESEDTGTLYFCDGYTVTVHTCTGGDLEKTLLGATGFPGSALHTMQTESGGICRTEGVWSAAGEEEVQVGRILVLDDGNYHYVLTCMTDASQMGALQETWQDLFSTFRLVSPEEEINTGS